MTCKYTDSVLLSLFLFEKYFNEIIIIKNISFI